MTAKQAFFDWHYAWYIERVGRRRTARKISDYNATYMWRSIRTVMRIDRIDGGVLFDIKGAAASKLASAYKACSQACSHPTVDTNHPKIGEPELIEALTIIVNHLQSTIYDHKKLRLLDQVMSEK
jgi:hypothetical protein